MKTNGSFSGSFLWVVAIVLAVTTILMFIPKHLANTPPYDANIGMPTNVMNFSKVGGWVRVINKTPISNNNSAFEPGNICVVNYNGDFTKVDRQGIWTIVSYQAPKASKPAGTQCGSGTFFAVSGDEFAVLRNNQIAFSKEMTQTQLFVEEHQGREGEYFYRKLWPRSAFTWVQVANTPNGATNANGVHIDFGDHCGINKRDLKLSLIAIREHDQAWLIRYDGPDGVGTECAHGTLFMAHLDHGLLVPDDSY